MLGLSYRELWALDFEFIAESGALPVPVCLVARELNSNRLLRLWQDELGPEPPFSTGPETLFVAFQVSSELGCFLSLGWPLPQRVLDLWVEHKHETNNVRGKALKHGLLAALTFHGLPSITKEQKTEMRALVLRGGPWSTQERRDILDYCQSDVDCLGPLLERMLPRIRSLPHGLAHALIRGRYMTAFTHMERTGIPVDTPTLAAVRRHRRDIQLDLIRTVDRRYHVFDATGTFKGGLFAGYLYDHDLEWPRTPSGLLKTDKDTFKQMSGRYPQLEDLRQLLKTLRQLKTESLVVGPDGRNRGWLHPFGTLTSRHAPKSSECIFGQPAWTRGLIKPAEGRALAYLDWCSQEICVAAALSGDKALMRLIETSDPYIATAVAARLAPAGATKQTHPEARELCKTVLLGMVYGMQPPTLSMRTGLSPVEARDLLAWVRRTFPTLAQWSDAAADTGQLTGASSTRLGWVLQTTGHSSRTIRNFPVQANGAEILRQAICLTTEAGISVCAQVHDAILIESDADSIGDVVHTARKMMAQASAVILGGTEIDTDAQIIAWPNRYLPDKGRPMWHLVMRALQKFDQSDQTDHIDQADPGDQSDQTDLP